MQRILIYSILWVKELTRPLIINEVEVAGESLNTDTLTYTVEARSLQEVYIVF
jgi:hypothetical protein